MYKTAFKRFDKLHQENDGDIAQEIKILLIYLLEGYLLMS
jgi:hypothetical protein